MGGVRRLAVGVALAALVTTVVACATDDGEGLDVLPPIRTTTTTSTTTTTISDERIFWEVKPGETLSIIAARFEVPVSAIVELNGIENPDSIPAGEIIEIPRGVRLVTEFPETTPAPEATAPG